MIRVTVTGYRLVLKSLWTCCSQTRFSAAGRIALRSAGLFLLVAFSLQYGVAAPAEERGKSQIQTFDYRGVTLGEGLLKRHADITRDFYLRIPSDDLLKGFRQRAGKPAPGKDLGGWYSSDTFHVFGQILSGLARFYAATGNTACRDKAYALLDGWAACLDTDGYFFFSSRPNAPHYIYDKMVGGLVDMHLYAGHPRALEYLRRITGWAETHLDRKRPYGGDPNEWYTLSENLFRAYLVTNEKRFRDFARVWEYTDYWNLYAQRKDIFGVRSDGQKTEAYHAYSHVNTLGGAGAGYRVTGDPHYLITLKNAYDYLQSSQCFVTGGYGPNEQLLPRPRLIDLLNQTASTFETQCGSWAGIKMAKYLLQFTGDAKYGDWIEKLLYNGVCASLQNADDGRVFYYSDYCTAGSEKHLHGAGWTCCSGTRPMVVADFHDVIYFHDAQNLYVNLYTTSSVAWQVGSRNINVRQETRFPEKEETTFTVTVKQPTPFGLRLRVPIWISGEAQATINGIPLPIQADAKHWWTIRRIWKDGDKLTLRLPMALSVQRMDAAKPYPAAVTFGPLALAFRAGKQSPAKALDLNDLPKQFAPSSGEPLTFRLTSAPDILVRPFYAIREAEPYYLYLDPASAHRFTHRSVTFSANWNDSGIHRFSNTVGATAEFAFEGTGVRWLGYRYDDAGFAEVQVDGKVVATVDQYGPGRELPFDWRIENLPPGKHTIKLTLLLDKPAASKDRFLNVAGFEVIE